MGTTTQKQVRLTPADLEKIEAIRERFGLPAASSAIRYAVETVYRSIEPAKKIRKSQPKGD